MFARVMALATAIALSGCSFVFVRGPKDMSYRGVPPPSCTHSFAVPIVDAAITALALGGVIYFASSDDKNKELGMLVEGGIAAGFGTSALLGRGKVKRCHRATDESTGANIVPL
jgi:hypothetical protein